MEAVKPEDEKVKNNWDLRCEICIEPDSFTIELGCGHSCCTDCLAQHVSSNLHRNVSTIGCPVSGCFSSVYLDPEHCRGIIPPDISAWWETALCEAAIGGSRRLHCPFEDCSETLLIDDGHEPAFETECPNCRRSFCSQCGVPWHAGLTCPDPSFVCEICDETRSVFAEWFAVKGCAHSYCADCVSRYVSSKLDENVSTIGCPETGCGGFLDPEHCRQILPPEVFDRWGRALCEAAIGGSRRIYCPYKDCSAMMVVGDGDEDLRDCECQNCGRVFCAQCRVTWHTGMECSEFQKLDKSEREKEDLMLMNLAKNKRWRRCSTCKIFVEKLDGCLFMKCRCGTAFCYNCGNIFPKKNNHYCPICQPQNAIR